MFVDRPITVNIMGYMEGRKIIQVFAPIQTFNLVVSQWECMIGVMEHVLVLRQGEGFKKTLLKEMGWTMMDQMRTLPPIDECPDPNLHLSMNIILWNYKGALNPNFHQSVDNIISCHSPSIMFITETRVGGNKAKEITDRLSFDGAAHADTMGYAGGIWALWHTEIMDVTILAFTEQEIHAFIKEPVTPAPFVEDPALL
ncbi:uncharacterized protein LOC115967261 [Quercus lobata]|uniref:uncharacterized protein LOC115967261 n=1 Tax=Quercus lobata TaxID=97700 RepID=UPI0012453802|nr:uncharacterized protein LOC115967261 [Quercus lobata]